ncbi:nuclear transport factor 2 family protein [Aquihabitans sp. McL0605]|uniref:nuclear transport factor 2 family protein n=1 Tax=Aquihabitans sp. McL0605 TaxID=3415671 RepID=UPI003CEE974D
MAASTYAEVAEGVKATIARYTHALDDGRTDDVVDTYCPDGVFDLPGTGTFEGHDALRAAYAKWAPRVPQRHLISNTLVSEWDDHQATATSDVVLLIQIDSAWKVQFVARYTDVLHHDDDGGWMFHRRTVA